MEKRTVGCLTLAFVGLVVLANWLASKYIVSVPFTPYLAPAGVFAIGAILVIRDWLQQITSFWYTLALVYVAGLLSWLLGDVLGWTTVTRIAVASAVAFTVSETLEAIVFTPVRRRSLTFGVALSATVGLLVDSLLFLYLAFGSEAFLRGQVIGKAEMVAVGVALTAARRRLVPRGAFA